MLCVAQNLSYNIRTYLKGGEHGDDGDYYHVKAVDLKKHSRLQILAKREQKRYIVGKWVVVLIQNYYISLINNVFNLNR